MLMLDRDLSRTSPPPSGRSLGPGDLPSPETRRWVARRKAQVVTAVRAGVLAAEEVCRRYHISPEELASWERALDRHGPRALRVTKLQEFRQV
jgi:hypothetical protein